MENDQNKEINPWKWATLGIIGLGVVALAAGLVGANYKAGDEPSYRVAQTKAVESSQTTASRNPSAADIEECNAYAASMRNKTEEAVKGAIIGGAVGAGVGAAGGAIAKGGKGAGKGAGIGSLLGATVGTLYGLNQANDANAQAQAAYRECMAARGYRG